MNEDKETFEPTAPKDSSRLILRADRTSTMLKAQIPSVESFEHGMVLQGSVSALPAYYQSRICLLNSIAP